MMSLRSPVAAAAAAVLFAAALLVAAPAAFAQAGSVEQKIESTYVLTKPTADMTDIVKPGDVLVLKKDNLFMCSITSAIPSINTYKNGKLSQSFFNKMKFFTASGNTPTVPTRMFVGGEKVFLTGVEIKDDAVQLSLLSDVMNGRRYYAFLKFPVAKGTAPSADRILDAIAQVVSVEPAGNAQPALPTSRTIALGQTKDQVMAILGQPTTVVQLGSKEVDYFPTMKVTFVNGHVADVQ